ncbi:MAG: Stp1/IreP family PP2C-type Ser/Thr phosphatase, partial [Myxococcales bacterium]|nr:Stp1/IreP family PP2C-type Ser/Thr phosphatase [Myxococcales bacterium]
MSGEPSPASPEGGTPEQTSEIRVRLFGRTDVGQVREHNEDNFLVADLTRKSRGLLEADREQVLGPRGALMAVCDGMGGAAAGEIASQLAVDILYERMTDGPPPADRNDLARRLVRAIEDAGLRIYNEAKADRSRRGMGTTSTAAALIDNHLFLGQVGDSRAYLLRQGKLVQVTRDQSLVNQLIEAGQLTEEEAETFEHNNIILQALGTSDTVQVDLTYVQLRKGDTLLLCSDGLSGMIRFDDMRDILRSSTEPLDLCKQLTERANAAGGHDNITVIIVQFDGEGLRELDEAGITELQYRKYILENDGQGASYGQNDDAPPGALFRPDDPSQASAGIRPLSVPPGGWQERAPHVDDDKIDIPGTHVPAWIVALIVLGVVGALFVSAVLLLK